MKFLCDNCQAQYMIADEKVGSAGVRVRCKKCSHVIFVKRAEDEAPTQDSTVVVSQEKMAQLSASSAATGEAEAIAAEPPVELPPPPVAADSDEPAASLPAAGLEDEIGMALDSMFSDTKPAPPVAAVPKPSVGSRPPVVLGPSPLSRAPSPFGKPAESGTVDPLSFDPPELTQLVSAVPSAVAPSAAAGATKSTEWFIAVQDEQVGPLKVADIKERFEKGEVSADTLVWSTGLTDWRPLSNVEELAELILPKKEIVRISRLPIPAEPAKEQPKKDPIAFRPSAASALASLASMAKEELAVSERSLPPPPRAPEPVASRGAEMPASAFLAGLPAPPPSSTAIPVAEAPAISPPNPGLADYRSSPLAQTAPRRAKQGRSTVVAIAVAAVVILLAGAASATYFLVIKPQHEIEARLEQQQRADAQRAKDEAKAKEDAQAAALAAQKSAAPVPVPSPAPTPSPTPVAPPIARTNPLPESPRGDSARDKHGNKHGKTGKSGGETPVAEAPAHSTPPPPAKSSGGEDLLAAGDVDKEFAKELEGGNDSKPAKHGPYIPPPPGQGDLPASLSQADIVGAVSAHRDSFAKCVQEQKKRDPSASGTVVMRWRIRPDGRSSDIAAKGEDYADSPLAGCFKGQIAKLHFGAYRGPQMAPIEFPFSF